MGIPRLRSYQGPALLSYGFRPFFLFGAAYAGISILFWLPIYSGNAGTLSLFLPVDWHIHEMLFGYLAAIVTGFLLTAIPNWTGRLPVQGMPLLGLVLLWFAGRIAVFFSASIGWQATAVIDCAFLVAVAAAAAIEIASGRNWRNLKVLLPLAVLTAANVLFHVEAHINGISDFSRRLGVAAAAVLIMIIGGRIIPSFTRNWLARENPGRLPAAFGRFDGGTILVSVAAFGLWVALPDSPVTGVAMTLAAALNLARLCRWAGDRTLRDPLVLILHLAYAFVPLGLALVALAAFFPRGTTIQAAAFHALGSGAIGVMTLAVMVRATLGHTGRRLEAGKNGIFVFAAILLAALTRIVAAIAGTEMTLVHAAGAAWAAAFLGYCLLYGRALLSPRIR